MSYVHNAVSINWNWNLKLEITLIIYKPDENRRIQPCFDIYFLGLLYGNHSMMHLYHNMKDANNTMSYLSMTRGIQTFQHD